MNIDYSESWVKSQLGVWRSGLPLLQRLTSLGLIKDAILPLLSIHLCNGKRAWKKGGAARSQTQGLWFTVLVLCHWAAASSTKNLGSPTFISCPFAISRSMNRNGKIGSLINLGLLVFGLDQLEFQPLDSQLWFHWRFTVIKNITQLSDSQEKSIMILIKSMWYTIMLTGNKWLVAYCPLKHWKLQNSF